MKNFELIPDWPEETQQKILEFLTPDEWYEAQACEEVAGHVVVAQYDGHDLNLTVYTWSDLFDKYEKAAELAASWAGDEYDPEDMLFDAWIEVAG